MGEVIDIKKYKENKCVEPEVELGTKEMIMVFGSPVILALHELQIITDEEVTKISKEMEKRGLFDDLT